MDNKKLTELCAVYKKIKMERQLARATYRGFKRAARIIRRQISRERQIMRETARQEQTERLLDSMIAQLKSEAVTSKQAAKSLAIQGFKVK